MKELEKIRNWNQIKESISKIQDTKTRQMYYKALLARATEEWGFNPEKPGAQNESVKLEDWEQEILENIQDYSTFGIDTGKERREKTHKEALTRMKDFISKGGKLEEIPENCKVTGLYIEGLLSIANDLFETVDSLTKG